MMANTVSTRAEARTQAPSGKSLAQAVDRWIYVFMAASFVAYTLIVFIPDSLAKIAAVEAGERAQFEVVESRAGITGSAETRTPARQSVSKRTGDEVQDNAPHRALFFCAAGSARQRRD
jgi:hypothetical protein